MNERIKKLAEQAKGTKTPGFPVWKFYNTELEKFAELIYKDIITVVAAQALSNESALDVFKNLKRIYEGVEESQGWVCPKCGTDRTKAACPKGHSAALTGDCPMYGVAHGVEK